MNYSYVMGISNIDPLKNRKFNIRKIEENYGVSFSDSDAEFFEAFIRKNLEKGYWNEYIGKEKVFIFKFENGDIKKYILNDNNKDEILNLCRQFAEFNFESIEQMLKDNDFYYQNIYYDHNEER